jgi:4-aminobutyrate aminotransferase-like enzyme
MRAQFVNLVSDLLPEGITHLQLYSGGAEAVEAAFRLAKSVTKKFEFVGFWGGYHGKTAGVLGLLGGSYRNHQGPFPPGMHLSPYANCYRCPWKLEYPSCGLACAEHLRNVMKNDTQGEVAAVVLEPMQGTAGNVVPPDDFVRAVRDIADEFGALLIADEILTGFGRTGTMWASEQFDLAPDIMTIGKGIGGGFPLSAVASSFERMSARPFGEPSGSSSSYGGNPLAAAAGLGAVEIIIHEKLVENSARLGALMLASLKELQQKYRFIGDVRGRGLMIGVEMVADRATKEPLDQTITRALFHEALNRGLVTMSYSHVIRINPPLVLNEEEAMCGIDILDQSFAAIARKFGLD